MRLLIHDYAGHPFQSQLSRELARRGHSVAHAYAGNLLTPRGALRVKPESAGNLNFIEVPMSQNYRANKYSFLKRRAYEVAYGRELARFVRQLRPDVILSGNTPTEPQWKMIQAAREIKIPVVSWVQDFYSLAVMNLATKKLPLIGSLVGRWYRYLDRMCFRGSAGIIAITEDFLPELERFGVPAIKITVIPNWAPLDELPMRPRRNCWSAKHGLDDKFVFLYSGTLAMKHNPDLLRQLAIHFRRDPTVRVMVVSEGPGADYLQTCKEWGLLDNLIVVPFEDFSAMPEVLAAADVLLAVLESDAGVFSVPSKILTYHCASRPILAAIAAENLAARIVNRAGSGICVAPDLAAYFVGAAARLREDVSARESFGAAARRYAEANFEIRVIADRFEQCLQKALSRGS